MSDFHRGLENELPRLRRYARALTRNGTKADDLVQDTLTRAIQKEHLWEPGTDLRAWLFTIMHNQSVNQLRHTMRENATVDLHAYSHALVARTDPTASRQLREVERALAELPQEQHQVILLVGLEDMSYEDAASILNIPVGTVRSRPSRGPESLRKLMEMEDSLATRAAEHHLEPTPLAA
jgi:RNA polymerase sigma-70 factor, ECF subfamily